MLAWGACGVAGAALAPVIRGRIPFAALCFVLGFAFSALMDVWLWVSFWPHTWQAFTVVFAQGVWFDMAHAVGNVVIALAIGPGVTAAARALRAADADGGRMGLKIAVAAVALALAASPSEFVASHQQSDGGFAETGQSSDANLTAWAVLGLTRGGEDTRSLAGRLPRQRLPRRARTTSRCASSRSGLSAATPAPWSPGSRACAARTDASARSSTRRSGACSRSAPPAARRERASATCKRAQRPSGGWSWYPRGAPDSNDTAAAIQALRAAGVGPRAHARSGAGSRTSAGSSGPMEASRSSQAARRTRSPPRGRSRLSSPQTGSRAAEPSATSRACAAPDGSYRYSKRYAVTPVWVTSQVLPALARKPFPLR